MNLPKALKQAKGRDWQDAGHWLFWTAFGMMPLWLLLILLWAFTQPVSLGTFTGQGEFALYSAGILAGAIYVVTKESNLSTILPKFSRDHPDSAANRLGISFPNHRILIAVIVFLLI